MQKQYSITKLLKILIIVEKNYIHVLYLMRKTIYSQCLGGKKNGVKRISFERFI